MIRPLLIAACSLALPLVGCASVPEGARTESAMAPEAYPGLFDASREVLARRRFTLDRVDAARGVITTLPKRTAGLATPWDTEQSSLSQEAQDLVHQQERIARVTFEPPEAPTRVLVEVVVHRVRRPNWRVETDAIRLSTHARDPLGVSAGQRPEGRQAIEEDRRLAARILAEITATAGLGPAPEPTDGP